MLTSSSNLGWSQLARRDSGLMKHSLIQNFGVKITQGWLNWFTRLWWHVALTTERICAGNKQTIFPHFAYFLSLILYKETFPLCSTWYQLEKGLIALHFLFVFVGTSFWVEQQRMFPVWTNIIFLIKWWNWKTSRGNTDRPTNQPTNWINK